MNTTDQVNVTESASGSGSGSGDFLGFGFSFMVYDPLSPVAILQKVISLIGLLGNIIAMVVVLRGRAIRKHASYILLFNQSLSDSLSCLLVLIWPLVLHISRATQAGKHGVVDYLVCVFVNSRFAMRVMTVISTYNLMLMAVERMLSVVYPIFHRMHANNSNQRLVAIFIWPAIFLLTIPYIVANNGINKFSMCHYNDRMVEQGWFNLIFESFALYLPLLVILASYTMIVNRLRNSQSIIKKRVMNVLKMLVTVVVIYVLCSALRNILTIMTSFGMDIGSQRVAWFIVAYSMRIVSFCINPFIYTLQYSDYRTELKRLLGFTPSAVGESSGESSSSSDGNKTWLG